MGYDRNQHYHKFTATSVQGRATVDGRNPAPVGMENLPVFTRFYTSQVVQDFFHQQYVSQVHGGSVIFSFGLKWIEEQGF